MTSLIGRNVSSKNRMSTSGAACEPPSTLAVAVDVANGLVGFAGITRRLPVVGVSGAAWWSSRANGAEAAVVRGFFFVSTAAGAGATGLAGAGAGEDTGRGATGDLTAGSSSLTAPATLLHKHAISTRIQRTEAISQWNHNRHEQQRKKEDKYVRRVLAGQSEECLEVELLVRCILCTQVVEEIAVQYCTPALQTDSEIID